MSGTAAGHPAGTTVYSCPLPECRWTFTQSPPDPFAPGVATGTSLEESLQRAEMAIMAEWLAEAERAVGAHLATHTLLEWVTGVNRLSGTESARWTQLREAVRSELDTHLRQAGWDEQRAGKHNGDAEALSFVLAAMGRLDDVR
jgi:hypothetical protein